MIYSFIGQPGAGKTTLAKKLHNFLKTDKRNWRRSVFHLDSDEFRELFDVKDWNDTKRRYNSIYNLKTSYSVIEYLHNNGCDVVVSFVNPFKDIREEFKDKCGSDFTEIYVHTTEKRDRDDFRIEDYQHPEINFIDIDTTKDSPDISFSKLINHLNKLGKL